MKTWLRAIMATVFHNLLCGAGIHPDGSNVCQRVTYNTLATFQPQTSLPLMWFTMLALDRDTSSDVTLAVSVQLFECLVQILFFFKSLKKNISIKIQLVSLISWSSPWLHTIYFTFLSCTLYQSFYHTFYSVTTHNSDNWQSFPLSAENDLPHQLWELQKT